MNNLIKHFCLLLIAGGCMAACSKDDLEKDVDTLKKPVPSGLIFVDAAPVTVVKGTQFQLRLRVNPSGVELTRDNLELDLRNSDTYLLVEETANTAFASSKASYVTPSDYYAITGVEPDRNQAGETLDGQWVVTVETRGEANFRHVADLYLVVDYTDAGGTARKVSSPALPVQIVPTVDEGVVFGYSGVQAFRTKNGAVNPYILFIDVHAYRNEQGEEWHYDRQFIRQVNTSIHERELTADVSTLYEKYYISFTPDDQSDIWKNLESGQVKKAASEIGVELVDFGQTKKTFALPAVYCPRKILVKCEIPLSELNANIDDLDYVRDLSAELAEYGLTADFTSKLARQNLFGSYTANESDYVIIDEFELRGEGHTFKPVINIWVMQEVAPGFAISEDEAAEMDVILSSFPQGKGAEHSMTLSDWEIRTAISAAD